MDTPPSTNDRPSAAIVPFDETRLPAVVECITRLWSTDNVIAQALRVGPEEYRSMAQGICEQALADGLGLMLVEHDTDRIVGFLTAIDLVDQLEDLRERVVCEGLPDRMTRWARLLGRGLQWYLDAYHATQPLQRGETIYYNIGGTAREFRSQGMINHMTAAMAQQVAIPRGYRRALGIATHMHSVHMLRTLKLGSTLHELLFADLDDPDLRRITEPPYALVSVTPLPRASGT